MKSPKPGTITSKAELLNVSPWGLWVLVDDREFYLPYKQFPFFENATIAQLRNVELLFGFHLRWPEIDVDLHVHSLEHVDQYPLVDKQYGPKRVARSRKTVG